MNPCPCGRPVIGAVLCRACGRDLARLLAEVPDLLDELIVTLTRQDRMPPDGAGGGQRTEQPLPYRLQASDAHRLLVGVLRAWARETGWRQHDPLAAPAGWLAENVETLRRREDAPTILDEVDNAVRRARDVIDHPVRLVWLGTCRADLGGVECSADLHGQVDDLVVACPFCGSQHDALARRQGLLVAAADQELPAADLARLAPAYGLRTTRHAVNGLVRRGRLEPVGLTDDERPTYRVGDLLDLLRN